MSNKSLEKRRKSAHDLEPKLSEKQLNKKTTSLNKSESYLTAYDAFTSDSEVGGQQKKKSTTYKFSTGNVQKKSENALQNETETRKNFKSTMSMHNLQQVDTRSTINQILKEIVAELNLPIESKSVQEEPIPVRSGSKNQQDETPYISKLSQTYSNTKDFDEDQKPTENQPITQKRSKKSGSHRDVSEQSTFCTNLQMGHAFVYMVLPPDGGYGWVIVFISFLTQIIIDGIVYSIGITLPFMAKDFNVGPAEIIFVSALQISFYFLSGPISSAIINKFGFRKVAIIGCISASCCLTIASFSPNLKMLIIFYSILGGPSLSMVWVSSQLIIGYYFEKFRPIANGLSCSGSGVGLFLFVEINNHLIPMIGWRNNTRFQVGLIIVALFLSFAFVEVPPSKIGIIREQKESGDSSDSELEELELKTFNYTDPSTIEPEDRAVEYMTLENMPITETKMFRRKAPSCCQRLCCKCCPCCVEKRLTYDEGDADVVNPVKRYMIKKDIIDKQDLYYTGPAEYNEHDRSAKREIIDGKDVELIDEERPVEAINYTFAVQVPRKSLDDEVSEKRYCGCIKPFPKKIKKAFRILFDFRLFQILEFKVLFFSAVAFALGLNVPFLFSKARLSLPSDQTNLIPSVIGASNFVSRISSGFIAFKFKRYVVYLCGGAITFGGAIVFLSAFLGQEAFWFQLMYGICFGLAPGFFSTLRAIIYVKYLGLQNLTNAFGLIAMGMGSGIFMGTVLSGYFNDITGDYMLSFIFSGICMLTSGVLKLLLPTICWRLQRNSKV